MKQGLGVFNVSTEFVTPLVDVHLARKVSRWFLKPAV